MISVFVNVLIPVLIIFLIGYIIGRFFDMNSKTMSTLSIYILTPALVFYTIYNNDNIISESTLKIFLASSIVLIGIFVIVEVISRIFKIPPAIKTIIALTLIFSNSGNFGIPINEYAYGADGLYIATIIMVIYNIYINTLGVFLANRGHSDIKKSLIEMVKVPAFYAIIIGLAIKLMNIEIPLNIYRPIESIGRSALPVNLLLVGINLSKISLGKNMPLVLGISGIKLFLIPFLSFFILLALGIEGNEFNVTLTQIGMPSAVYCTILISHYGGDKEIVSEIVLLTSLLSFVSLTILISILNMI